MTAASSPTLLSVLRRRGVSLSARGDRVVVDAPLEMATPDFREAVAAAKKEILQQLHIEDEFLDMPLSQFAQSKVAIEVAVPRLPSTIWFVPDEAYATKLVSKGVRRGRIWTAAELRVIAITPDISQDELLTIARVKARFDGEVLVAEEDC